MILPLLWHLTTSPAPERPLTGPQLLAEAVAALGGRARLTSFDRWLVEGTGRENLSAELQGRTPDRPTIRPHREWIAVDRRRGRVAWERRTPRVDSSLRWRRFISGRDSSGVVDRVAGTGAMRGEPTPAASIAGIMRRIPHLLLLEASDTGTTVTAARSEGGIRWLDITTTDGAALRLGFDRRARLARLRYSATVPGIGLTSVQWHWYGWRPDRLLGWTPGGHRVEVAGVLYQEVSYNRYAINQVEAERLVELDRPLERPLAAGPRTRFESIGDPLRAGVHPIDVSGFRALLVEFASFVALIEAPEEHPGFEAIPAEGLDRFGVTSAELRKRVDELARGRPLRYLVVTHHHDDHTGGLGRLTRPETTVLVAPTHQRAAARALRATREAPGRIEPVADRLVIEEAGQRVEILRVGRNPHTDDGLVVWLPASATLFQGDLFYFQPGGVFPPVGRERMNVFLTRWLAARQLAPRAVLGVHSNGVAGANALEWMAAKADSFPAWR